MIGFSTPAGLSSEGMHSHAVVVALLAASDARVDVQWLAGYTQGSREVSQQLAALLKSKPKQPCMLFADGFNADAEQLCGNLPQQMNLFGALSSGDLHAGNASQISGTQSGAGGLALAPGRTIRMVIGFVGWQQLGRISVSPVRVVFGTHLMAGLLQSICTSIRLPRPTTIDPLPGCIH
jgi:hypothetical protein